jgi:iron complex outermembrane receptor protein
MEKMKNSPFLLAVAISIPIRSRPLTLAMVAALAMPGAIVAAEQALPFDIPAQALGSALNAYAEQVGVQLSYPAALTAGLESPGVTGRYTPAEALEKLLTGTGIAVQSTRNGTLTLERKAPPQKLNRADPPVPSSVALAPVVVTETTEEQQEPAYQVETATAGTKFPIEITRVPQGIQVITESAIEDRGTVSIGDLIKQVPSANLFGLRYSRFPKVNIRGFTSEQTRNGMRQLSFSGTDFSALSHIQSVEILKGPGSTTFGQGGDGGGIINVVTKRPYDWFDAEVSFTRGGWTEFDGDITSGQWDLNVPLTPDGALKARFTGEIEGSDIFINFQPLNRENFGLALSYDNGGPVRAFVNAEYQHRKTLPNPGLPVIGTVQSSGGLGRIARDTYLGEPRFDNQEAESPSVQAWLDIDVAENWKVSPRFQYHQFDVDQDQIFLSAATLDPVNRRINVSRTGHSSFTERDWGYVGQIDITGTLETGPLKHQIFLGGDYTNWHLEGGWVDRVGVPGIDALDPSFLNSPPATSPNRLKFRGNWEVGAVAFQDVIAITSKFDLMGGVRHARVSGDRTIVSGRNVETDTDITTFQGGGTFHVTDSVHLFAGYGEGFNVADAVGFGTASGRPFDLGRSEHSTADCWRT